MRFFIYSLLILHLAAVSSPGAAQVIEGGISGLLQLTGGAESAGLILVGEVSPLQPAFVEVEALAGSSQDFAGFSLPGLEALGSAGTGEQSPTPPDHSATDSQADSTDRLGILFTFSAADADRYALTCTGADQDRDGVCDRNDRCPNTPPGVGVLSSGCHLGSDRTLVLYGVHFAFDSAQLTRASAPELFHALQVLRQNHDLQIEIAGHTDDRGADEYNRRLSTARAKAVYQVMVRNGIEPERISFKGYGRSQPIAANTKADGTPDLQGMAENRRVEFRILSDYQAAAR